MSEQPSTYRTMLFDTAIVELPATTLTMFAGILSIPTSSQLLEEVHPKTVLTVWSLLVCSSGISYVESQQIDPSQQYQFG